MLKKSVEKIEEIGLFNNDRTRIVECIADKKERDQRFETLKNAFSWNKWMMKTDVTKLEKR